MLATDPRNCEGHPCGWWLGRGSTGSRHARRSGASKSVSALNRITSDPITSGSARNFAPARAAWNLVGAASVSRVTNRRAPKSRIRKRGTATGRGQSRLRSAPRMGRWIPHRPYAA